MRTVTVEGCRRRRALFVQRKALNRTERDQRLVGMLSPYLKLRAVRKQCEWLRCVPYLILAGMPLIAAIEDRLSGQVYPPEERIAQRDTLCHLSSGMVRRSSLSAAARVLRIGCGAGALACTSPAAATRKKREGAPATGSRTHARAPSSLKHTRAYGPAHSKNTTATNP